MVPCIGQSIASSMEYVGDSLRPKCTLRFLSSNCQFFFEFRVLIEGVRYAEHGDVLVQHITKIHLRGTNSKREVSSVTNRKDYG